MKLKQLTLVFSFTLLCAAVVAQKTKSASTATKKGQLIGLNLLLADYKGPNGIKSPSTSKGYSTIKDMSKGISLSYWKGLTSTIDFSAKINALFHDYNLLSYGQSDKTEFGLELEPTVNVRPFGDGAKLAPFVTTGAGIGDYTGHFGAYVPAGVGLQFNFNNTTYLFIQAQYRFSLTKKVFGDNLLYSFGFAEHF